MDNNLNWDNVKEVSESKILALLDKTKLRMASNFMAYGMHIEETLLGNKKRVNCPGVGCPLCKAGKEPIKRYAFKIINRGDGKAYVLEVGGMVMNQIKKFAQDPQYGNPLNYDIFIKRIGTGKQTKYEVLAAPQKTPITLSEMDLINELDINKYIKLTSIEDIRAIGFKDVPVEMISNEEQKIGDPDFDNL